MVMRVCPSIDGRYTTSGHIRVSRAGQKGIGNREELRDRMAALVQWDKRLGQCL